MLSFLAPQRKCGECKACCTAIAVEEIKKPFNAHCEYECDKGCSIYKDRPPSCAGYECGWLMGFGDAKDRPDQIGGVLHHSIDDHGFWLQIHLTREVTSAELARLMMTAEVIYTGAGLRGIKLIRHNDGQNCGFEPDLKKYPGTANSGDKTVWKTWDDVHYFLDAPKRKSLKVVT